MRCACALAILLAGAAAHAGRPVVGGETAPAGAWPDVAAVLAPSPGGDQAECTGTLVAPTIVLTAGHCWSSPFPDNVWIGTSSLARPAEGEMIAIARGVAFPDAEHSEDVTVLVLARAATEPPRPIATGWARFDIANGAAVALVGFGAVNKSATMFVDDLQQAQSTITDADCSKAPGCNVPAQPAGELGAGGMGIDTCPGDSGGPLYLLASYGTFLAGVTSRSYDDATLPCSQGGIYERPDKIVDWIEQVGGVPVARGPEPAADPITAVHGDAGETQIAVNDPVSSGHSFAIKVQPAAGRAAVRGDGAVRVCVDPAAAPGGDSVTVTITDKHATTRALDLKIPIQIEDGAVPPRCDLSAFEGGGCCDAGGDAPGAVPLAIGVLAMLRRRRR